ncbi:hypothetical protein P4V41_07405 [Fictibacillus nanhaiensis]|uniref:hypothetical protein n=1 Tax=Fictibacillus nanhaiensis TaxID=742169 RepID=UPI002E229F0C|nr:hypothetical protein [Fictibacillus nanhaiensis]
MTMEMNKEMKSYYINVLTTKTEERYKLMLLIEDRTDFNTFMQIYKENRFIMEKSIAAMIKLKHDQYFNTYTKLMYAIELNKGEAIKLVFM